MSILEQTLPVTVYKSTDTDAPAPPESSGDLITLIKACLVTGYGDKQPLGWTLEREDMDNQVKVFRPKQNGAEDYLVELSEPAGKTCMHTNIYLPPFDNPSLIEANNGNFVYYMHDNGYFNKATKWMLVGTERTFALFLNCYYKTGESTSWQDKWGVMYCVGDSARRKNDAKFCIVVSSNQNKDTVTSAAGGALVNSSKTYNGASVSEWWFTNTAYDLQDGTASTISIQKEFESHLSITSEQYLSKFRFIKNGELIGLPGLYAASNIDDIRLGQSYSAYGQIGSRQLMGASGSNYKVQELFMVAADRWYY